MLKEFLVNSIKSKKKEKKILTLKQSFINDEPLQNYMKLVYNTDEEDINDEMLLKSFLNNTKNTLMSNYLNGVAMKVDYEVFTTNNMKVTIELDNAYIIDETLFIIKHAKSNAINHIAPHGNIDETHRYAKELKLVADIITERNIFFNNIKLIIVKTNPAENEDPIFETPILIPKGEFLTEAISMIEKLSKQILSGQEPSECEDIWGGSRCDRYCQYASHRLGLCKKGRINESNN